LADADYVARPDEQDTPSGLRAVFMAAKKLSFQVGDIARAWPRPPKGEETFPVNTLRMLEMVARVHFAAGVSLLYEDWLSYSTDLHLRALAEIYAHVAWIREKGGVTALMTPRGRAVCLELGMARALQTELAELSADTPLTADATSVAAIGQEVTALQAAHASHNCTCDGRGRGYRTVRPTLAEMAKADPKVRARGAEWMYGYWKTASRVSHHSGFERMVKLHPSGARQVAPAEPWQRVGTFSALVTAYGSILEWTLELHPTANARALHDQLRSLLTDSAVQAAAAMRPQARPAPSKLGRRC